MKLTIKLDILGFVLYACIGLLMASILPDEASTLQLVCMGLSMLVLVIIDIRSFKQGLDSGCAITRNALQEALDHHGLEIVHADNRKNV